MNEPFPLNLLNKVVWKDNSLDKTVFSHFSVSLFHKNIYLILFMIIESTHKSDEPFIFDVGAFFHRVLSPTG